MVINPYIFKREPNTFIGGIAKLGGTGANAPILTAAELAAKMGISESIIKGFKVVGEDVECRITSDYNLKQHAFGSMDGLSSNNNIIYFNDPDGRMKIGGRNSFSRCQNLESLIVTGVTEIGESFCNFNPKLETLIVTSLITAVNQPFDHNVKLKEFTALNLNNFTGASNFFFGNTDLHTVNTPEINRLGDNHYRECVSLTQIINDNALTAGFHIFRDCSSIELISIKKIKSMGSNAFTNIKTNCVINCNVFLRTSNMGDIDANLLYAYTSRNATINFYDDNGNFVETYNPNPPNEIDWTVHPSPEQNSWRSIATDGNGMWIGVAYVGTNRILKSTDNGLTWSVQVTPENNQWISIATDGNGTWIGLSGGGTNRILKSTDNGLTWSVQVTPEQKSWRSIATDGNGTWIGVAYGDTNSILKSIDNGVTWTVESSPETNQWRSIATDGNGTWIGVAYGGTNSILKSIDNGVTWTVELIPELNFWISIATDGNGTWIGVAYGGTNRILKSTDNGLTWSVQVTPEQNGWNSIATDGNGTWIGVAYGGTNQILESIDNGVTWVVKATPENNQWYSIATDGNGTWIGVAGSGTNRILKGVEVY